MSWLCAQMRTLMYIPRFANLFCSYHFLKIVTQNGEMEPPTTKYENYQIKVLRIYNAKYGVIIKIF